MSESQSRAWVWANRSMPAGMPTGDRRSAAPTKPVGLADEHDAHGVALRLVEAGLGELAQRSGGDRRVRPSPRSGPSSPPSFDGERHAVEHVHLRNERAGGLLEVGLARALAGPVGRHAGGGQELAEPAAARLEIGPEGTQADGDRARDCPPGPIVSLRRSRGEAAGRGRRSARAARTRESRDFLKTCKVMPSPLDASRRRPPGSTPSSEGGPVVRQQLQHARQLEHVADRLGVGHDPESAADLAHLAVIADQQARSRWSSGRRRPTCRRGLRVRPLRTTSSSRSERYDDQDESRLPMSTTSATSSERLI